VHARAHLFAIRHECVVHKHACVHSGRLNWRQLIDNICCNGALTGTIACRANSVRREPVCALINRSPSLQCLPVEPLAFAQVANRLANTAQVKRNRLMAKCVTQILTHHDNNHVFGSAFLVCACAGAAECVCLCTNTQCTSQVM
jgi:hypothetical protein